MRRALFFSVMLAPYCLSAPISNNGYTSPHWRQSIYDKNCSDIFVTDGVRIVGDDASCTVNNALLLLLRQSFRYNSKRWAEDVRHTGIRIDRTLFAHDLMPLGAQHNLDLRYEPPITTCMMRASSVANESISSVITSATLLSTDPDSVTFAMFGAPTKSSKFVQARIFVNRSISLSIGDAPGLHAINNHAPSAAFLVGDNLAAGNMGWNDYDVDLYSRDGANYTDKRPSPSYRVGGENIGSLFRSNGSLLMSARFNVPYVPLDVSGHGYRSIGLYNFTSTPSVTRSDLVDWLSPDGCISACVDQLNRTCKQDLALNASSLLHCLPSGVGGTINETLYSECVKGALSGDDGDDCLQRKRSQFADGLLCAHRCRSKNQIYMSAISLVNGQWYGVAGLTSYNATTQGHDQQRNRTASSPLALCRLSKSFAWNPGCFDVKAASMHDVVGTYGHPVTSQVVELGDALLLASVGAPKDVSDTCAVYLHTWNASYFSFFQVGEKPSRTSTLVMSNMILPPTRRVRISSGSHGKTGSCFDGVKLLAYGKQPCRTTRVATDDASGSTFEVDCGLVSPSVDLHILLPRACRLYSMGPAS